MSVNGRSSRIPDGTIVRILRSGYGRAEVVEYRGPLGPGGTPIYRVLVQTVPEEAYMEVREDQLEVLGSQSEGK